MQIFEKLCSLYEEFTRCTDALGCRSLSMTAMEASYGYMCGEGRPEFRKHVDCFAEVRSELGKDEERGMGRKRGCRWRGWMSTWGARRRRRRR